MWWDASPGARRVSGSTWCRGTVELKLGMPINRVEITRFDQFPDVLHVIEVFPDYATP